MRGKRSVLTQEQPYPDMCDHAEYLDYYSRVMVNAISKPIVLFIFLPAKENGELITSRKFCAGSMVKPVFINNSDELISVLLKTEEP